MKNTFLITTVFLTACSYVEQFTGGSPPTPQESQALGASCRQTGRSLEECFERNPKADKSRIFEGWKEMNEYMAANNLKTLAPQPPAEPAAVAEKKAKEQAKSDADKASLEPDLSSDPEVLNILNSLEEIQKTRPVPGQREADQLLKLIKDSSAPDRVGEVSEFPPIEPPKEDSTPPSPQEH